MFSYKRKLAARPRKTKKPITSVAVVRKTVDAKAGSAPILLKIIGIEAPKTPAAMRFIIMAKPMTTPSPVLWNQRAVVTAIIIANAMPLRAPTSVSFQTTLAALVEDNSFVASARTATVRACVPALPPIEATIGINTARATICSIVASKKEITIDARIAVIKLTKSQLKRERVVERMAR